MPVTISVYYTLCRQITHLFALLSSSPLFNHTDATTRNDHSTQKIYMQLGNIYMQLDIYIYIYIYMQLEHPIHTIGKQSTRVLTRTSNLCVLELRTSVCSNCKPQFAQTANLCVLELQTSVCSNCKPLFARTANLCLLELQTPVCSNCKPRFTRTTNLSLLELQTSVCSNYKPLFARTANRTGSLTTTPLWWSIILSIKNYKWVLLFN